MTPTDKKEEIFAQNVKDYLMDTWHFRSFDGCWTPRASPIKIKTKIIKKKKSPIKRAKKAAWMVKHLKQIN